MSECGKTEVESEHWRTLSNVKRTSSVKEDKCDDIGWDTANDFKEGYKMKGV